MFETWVLDASMSHDAMWCYIPIEGLDTPDPKLVTGMDLLYAPRLKPDLPGELAGVIHMDGQAAVISWLAEHWPRYPAWDETGTQ